MNVRHIPGERSETSVEVEGKFVLPCVHVDETRAVCPMWYSYVFLQYVHTPGVHGRFYGLTLKRGDCTIFPENCIYFL